MARSISVVIPAWNEQANIADAVASAFRAGASEVVVADGNSEDETVAEAKAAGANVVDGARGRGSQLNAGAASAGGDVLLFLHADCRIGEGVCDQIEAAIEDVAVCGGGLRQSIAQSGRRYRWLERGNAWRAERLGWVYGDQAMFVRKTAFDQLGGFPAIPLMEDLEFSKRLKACGRVVLLDGPVEVDARRWKDGGVVTQTARNWAFVMMYHIGVPPERLAERYRAVR